MTDASLPPGPPRPGRRWLLPLSALIVAGVAAGAIFYFTRPQPEAPPVPPEPKAEGLEPAVLDAVRAAREQILREPRSADAWGGLGEVFLANELEEEGRVCFAEAERLDRENPRWPYYQAVVLINRGDREGALPFLRRALELGEAHGGENPAARLVLAEALLTLGRADEAEPLVRRAREMRPDDARARYDSGLLAVARQQWEAARGHLLECLGSPFARQKARVQLAAVCGRLGRAAEAEAFAAEADRLPADADWPDPFVTEYLQWAKKKRNRYKLAENLEAAGRLTEAARVLAPLTEEDPNDDLAQLTLGKMLARLGNFAAGERALRRALALAPRKVQPHYYLALLLEMEGEALAKRGDAARAEACFREAAGAARAALALKPDYGVAHMALGLARKRLGDRAGAKAAFAEAVRCNPEHGELHYYLAESLFAEGKAGDARPRYEQALRLAPPGAPWRAAAEARLAELPSGAPPPGG
jgi:tetratricopeptide (TPR) repeat protein